MEIELSDVSGLPDAFKPLVAVKDGKNYLNLATIATDFDAFKGKAVTAQQEAIDRRKALDGWKALGATPEEVQAKLAKGADPAIIDQMRNDFSGRETALKTRLSQIVTDRAAADLKAELAKVGVIPSALDDIAAVARSQMQIDEDGSVRIMGPDGKPMIGQGANGGATLADFAKILAASRPYAVADQGTGGGGKQPNSGGKPGQTTITRAALLALPPAEQAKLLASGVKPTD